MTGIPSKITAQGRISVPAEEFVAASAWVSRLVLEIGRKARDLTLGTFDRALSKLERAERL